MTEETHRLSEEVRGVLEKLVELTPHTEKDFDAYWLATAILELASPPSATVTCKCAPGYCADEDGLRDIPTQLAMPCKARPSAAAESDLSYIDRDEVDYGADRRGFGVPGYTPASQPAPAVGQAEPCVHRIGWLQLLKGLDGKTEGLWVCTNRCGTYRYNGMLLVPVQAEGKS